MAKYRFKEDVGKHRMEVKAGGKVEYRLLKPGELVELTDEQYRACEDKFEPADKIDAGPSSAELRAMADQKEKEERVAAEEAKTEALAKAKEAEAAALAAKAASDAAAKTGSEKKA
ncbi:MAG: hypothetical protein ACR2P3_00800 [Geminicoccaceae bacterium]